MVMLRCLIIDDNAGFLDASSSLLQRQGLRVVGGASNGADGVRLAAELAPDLILLDIELGAESGFTVARQLAATHGSSTREVILISTHPEDDFAELVEQSPTAGFIPKSDLSIEAIERLLNSD
jgi:DNA-binding NarL/FixJ family response regulator